LVALSRRLSRREFHLKRFAQTLEHGRFDAFFMADHLAVLNMPIKALRRSATVTSFEPFTLLSALARVTERIGRNCHGNFGGFRTRGYDGE
jgi:alkanesulfonate monooxygenase SsuD/methylene tetrahydromethanopterin reductase-like flavin-dependent oxidoreductase (luciferase family)